VYSAVVATRIRAKRVSGEGQGQSEGGMKVGGEGGVKVGVEGVGERETRASERVRLKVSAGVKVGARLVWVGDAPRTCARCQ
jgi:hypothetical protein